MFQYFTRLHLRFHPGGGGGRQNSNLYNYSKGGRPPNCMCKVYHNLGGSGGAPPGNFFDFEHLDITAGTFLDKKFSSYQFIAGNNDLGLCLYCSIHNFK